MREGIGLLRHGFEPECRSLGASERELLRGVVAEFCRRMEAVADAIECGLREWRAGTASEDALESLLEERVRLLGEIHAWLEEFPPPARSRRRLSVSTR